MNTIVFAKLNKPLSLKCVWNKNNPPPAGGGGGLIEDSRFAFAWCYMLFIGLR